VTGQAGASAQEHVVQVELTQGLGPVKEVCRVKDQDMRPSNVCFRIVQVKLHKFVDRYRTCGKEGHIYSESSVKCGFQQALNKAVGINGITNCDQL
jgi:hypothetical protein